MAKKAKKKAKKKATKKAVAKKAKKKKVATSKKAETITIRPLSLREINITLDGDTPLITHKFSNKAATQIADKQQQKRVAPKKARDPKQEFEDAQYRIDSKTCGIPVMAFKGALVSACSFTQKAFTKVNARGAFFVHGQTNSGLIAITNRKGKPHKPRMQEDTVRLPNGSADLRYRPYFDDWSVKVRVQFNEDLISLEELVNLFNIAGWSVGVGDWRPQKDGINGTFSVRATT